MLYCSSCSQTTSEPEGLGISGLKLSDIKPTYQKESPKNLEFRIFVFELPKTEYGKVKDVFGELPETPLYFNDRRGFDASGLVVGYGRNEIWDKIAEKLRKSSARKTETKAMVVFDDKGDDVVISNLDTEKTVFYSRAGGAVTGVTIGPGKLAWRIKAKPISTIRRTAQVEIVAIFKQNVDPLIRRMVGVREDDETVFDSAGFNLKMSNGDFVLLGPKDGQQNKLSMAELFFTKRGKFILPTVDTGGQEKSILKKTPNTLYKDVPLVRLYLIVCARVQN